MINNLQTLNREVLLCVGVTMKYIHIIHSSTYSIMWNRIAADLEFLVKTIIFTACIVSKAKRRL